MHEYLEKIRAGDFNSKFLAEALNKVGDEEYPLHDLRQALIIGLGVKIDKESGYGKEGAPYERNKKSDLEFGEATIIYAVDIPAESDE